LNYGILARTHKQEDEGAKVESPKSMDFFGRDAMENWRTGELE